MPAEVNAHHNSMSIQLRVKLVGLVVGFLPLLPSHTSLSFAKHFTPSSGPKSEKLFQL